MSYQIAVMSGKGGAGKTSITAALLKLLPEVVAVDADVNASNLPILLNPQKQSETNYFSMDVARIDPENCIQCGQCAEICAFNAIDIDEQGSFSVNEECEGCAACAWVCPQHTIAMVPHCSGKKYLSKIDNGFLLHADLIPGEDNSGKLIASIREEARKLAAEKNLNIILIDGPPGTSCQAISSLTGVQIVLAVLEESLSGLSDYKRLATLIERFRIPHLVLVNKAGLNHKLGAEIEAVVVEHGGEIVARIPFDMEIPLALSRLETLLDMPAYRPVIEKVYAQLLRPTN